jgi:choline dehydrogenase-like flavoprotein
LLQHAENQERKSSYPRQGVVDAQCQVYGADNLCIAGSAVFLTAGHANPTLTIVALALRLAEYLKGM